MPAHSRPRRRAAAPSSEGPSEPRGATRLFRIAAVNILLLVLLVFLVEAGARIFAPRDLRGVFNDPDVFIRKRPFVAVHPQRGFALVPGYDQGMFRVNEAGFRGPDLPENLTDHEVILALGESSTFGWGVGEGESYPAQLQEILVDRGLGRSPLVVNAGVPSYTSPQVRAYMEELLRRYAPRALLVSVLWNDALFACIPNWMPDYLAAQQPAPWRQVLLRHSGLYRALAIDPPAAAPTGPVDNEPALRFYAENLAAMARDCRRAGVQLFYLRPSVDPSHIPPEGMKIWRRTIPPGEFIELLDLYVAQLEDVAATEHVPLVRHRLCRADSTQSAYFLDPVHLNAAGNRILAEDVAAQLAENAATIFAGRDLPR